MLDGLKAVRRHAVFVRNAVDNIISDSRDGNLSEAKQKFAELNAAIASLAAEFESLDASDLDSLSPAGCCVCNEVCVSLSNEGRCEQCEDNAST